MKTSAVGAELFNVDGRTDGQTDRHDEAINPFSQCLHTSLKVCSQQLHPSICSEMRFVISGLEFYCT
jgi:hypothetical protein